MMLRLKRATAAALLCLALIACKTDLYSELSEREANEMIAIMQQAGLSTARRAAKTGGMTVQIEQTQFAEAVELLKSHGYPKDRYATLGDVFQGNGFVASQTEERARFIYAMSEELSRTISEINGVLSARVHVVLPATDPLSRDSTPSSASIFIRYTAQHDIKKLMPQIKLLVANSIEGLSYDKVSVGFVAVDASELNVPAAPQSRRFADDPVVLASAAGIFVILLLGLAGLLLRRKSQPATTSTSFVAEPAE